MAKDLVRHLLVAICPLANGEVAPLALIAFTADDRERHHDPIALLQLSVHAGTHLDDFAHHFVAHDIAGQHGRDEIMEEMKIRTADRAAGDLDDCVPGIFDLRVGDGITPNIFFTVPDESLHTKPPTYAPV